MKQKLTSVLLCMAMVLSMCTLLSFGASAQENVGVHVWDGTTADTSWYVEGSTEYDITTPEQLAGLSLLVKGGNAFSGVTFNLKNDLYLNNISKIANYTVDWKGNKWTAIGTDKLPFSGTFNGNGYTIYGAYVKTTSGNDSANPSVFGYVKGKILNLNLSKSYLNSAFSSGRDWAAGGLVSHLQNGTMDNCHVTDTYIATTGTGCGALVGALQNGTVKNCTSNNVNIYENGGNSACWGTGGIVGYIVKSSSGDIINCTALGGRIEQNGSGGAGGIVGFASSNSKANMYNCVNYAKIVGKTKAGGLYGNGSGTSKATYVFAYNCANFGTVTGGVYAGGAVGSHPKAIAIYNFLNVGSVSVTSTAENTFAAGIAGSLGYTGSPTVMVNCVNLGSVSAATPASEDYVAKTAEILASGKPSGTNLLGSDLGGKTLEEALEALNKTVASKNTDVDPTANTYYKSWVIDYAKIAGATVTLADSFSINFYVTQSIMLETVVPESVTIDGAVAQENTELSKDGYKVYTTYSLMAKEMSKGAKIAMTYTRNGKVATNGFTYSILNYAANQYNKTDDADVKALLEAIVYYGAAAEGSTAILDAFAKATGYVVDASYVANKYDALDLHKIVNEGDDTTLVAHSPIVSLYLDNTIRPCFQMEGAAYIIVEFNGKLDYRYDSENSYFIIDCLYATSLESAFRVKAYDENGDLIGQMKYSVATYILGLLDEGSNATDEQKTLAMATAVYMNQAKLYNIAKMSPENN